MLKAYFRFKSIGKISKHECTDTFFLEGVGGGTFKGHCLVGHLSLFFVHLKMVHPALHRVHTLRFYCSYIKCIFPLLTSRKAKKEQIMVLLPAAQCAQ